MKIGIISGSHRLTSQSDRVALYLKTQLESQSVASYFLSLAGNPLPLWDETVWSGGEVWREKWSPVATELQSCDGFIIVAPEWAGMVPPGLKNFLLLCTTTETGHKPALIVAVSSGIGGSYPVTELRTSGYKNNRLCFIPEHVIVRGVEAALVGEKPADSRDEQVRARLAYALAILKSYAEAMVAIRASGVINHQDFPHGM